MSGDTPIPNASDPDAGNAEELALVRAIQRDGPSNMGAWSSLLTGYQDRLYAVCLRMVSNPHAAADLTQDSMVKIIQGLSGYDGRSKLSTWMIRITMNTCLSYLRSQKLRQHVSLDAVLSDSGDVRQAGGRVGGGKGGSGKGRSERGGEVGRSGGDVAKKGNHRRSEQDQDVLSTIRSRIDADRRQGSEGGKGGTDSLNGVEAGGPAAFTGPGAGSADWRVQTREQSPREGVQLDERRRVVAAALGSLQSDQRAILVLRDVQGLDYDQIAEALGVAVGTVKSRLFRARAALREAIEQMGATEVVNDGEGGGAAEE